MNLRGEGVPRNLAEAALLFQRACDGGDALACNNLGAMYARGEGVAKNPGLAEKLYRKACDGDAQVGCRNLHRLDAK